MVIYTISEQPNAWNVHRYGDTVTAIAMTHSEEQATKIAFARAAEESPSFVMRIGMNGRSQIISYFRDENTAL